MKPTILTARLITGLVFVFSGFVKAVDPMGSAIKFEEYFLAFNLDFLSFATIPLALLLSSAELMIGLNLLAKLQMRFTAWLLLLFMSFFTILTFILALSNPVSDCGCFGDAIKLTNWQTFWKNIILFVPTVIVFIYRRQYTPTTSSFTEWYLTTVNFAIAVLISAYCLLHQPLLDFRPYSTGTHIPSSMVLPPDAPVDQYETLFIYERNGVQQEFTESNYPWQDSTWTWVETRQKLILKGEEPPIHDFSITTPEGNDITQTVLSDSGYVFLIVAPKLEKTSVKGMEKMNALSLAAGNMGIETYCLTSSATAEIQNFRGSFNPAFQICTTDETTLKTMIRANPGLFVLKEGTVIGKWNHRDAPEVADLRKDVLSVILTEQHRTIERLTLALIIIALLFFYSAFHRVFIR